MRNIDKYKEDIDKLCKIGKRLMMSMHFETTPIEAEKAYRGSYGDMYEEIKKNLPNFKLVYQEWYSEAKVLIKQLHYGERESNKDDLDDLINGVDKIIKTVF
ncbi:hypothetical protein [Sphingobacterium chuzhouense]|uniref:Uncharacterized protein n=1 Tax=Sphingobacterium chuzhouense TaxID=1742264 RepID=A0ABR7XS47_9SPHI|nr:hypothetical protein [Sphingobacterium chuzhouense]MBD1421990.1 hypothetical protein [Sphingobacterium chuzhouense]